MMKAPHVVAVGQLPPPVSGFSYITEQTIAAARAAAAELVVNNIASRRGASGIAKHLSRIGESLKACFSIARHARSPGRVCYVACEGGLGLVYTLAIIGTARLSGYRILLHHHSFGYITQRNALMSTIQSVGGTALCNVFLGEAMERGFRAAYSSRALAGMVLSNAAFVPPVEAAETGRQGPLVLGHLSNLTREKGLHIFLDVLRAAVAAGEPVRAVLAGPVADPSDRALIESASEEFGARLDYRGPLYGEQKDAFYRDIDVFVFPTEYRHEAQPTVLFEAQAAGCKIVSFERGCIAEQVEQDGLVIAQNGDFIAECLGWLRANRDEVRADRAATRARYAEKYCAARTTAENLFSLPGTVAAPSLKAAAMQQ
ncbi:glycosyltransferase family 4 protein [Novosphingobium sp.]|uniref:glycosyltransferase family 4 protein n=1 Tax=Novosphingobium sp. TaxID=1874826 RepID=UPI003BAC4EDA